MRFVKGYRQCQQRIPGNRLARPPSRAEANRENLQQVLGKQVQTKLRLGAKDDPKERAADAIAEQVMRTPDAQAAEVLVQRECTADETVADEEEEELVQAEAAEARCSDEEEETIQTKPAPGAGGTGAIAADTAARIRVRQGASVPLPAAERGFFQPRLGYDLAGVRLHTDAEAATLAGRLSARAFTLGRDIYFGTAQFQPGTDGRAAFARP